MFQKSFYTLFVLLLLLISSTAQANNDSTEFEFFVWLDDRTPVDSIIEYLEDINAEEVWENDDIDLAIWKIKKLPFVTKDGEVITTIDGAIRRAKTRTRIREVASNFQTGVSSVTSNDYSSCFDINNYTVAQGNTSTVKIAILDTGISDLSDNNDPNNNYNLTQYEGYDYVNNDPIPDDEHGHGSHLAGLMYSITHGASTTGQNIEYSILKTHDAHGQAPMTRIVRAAVDAIEDDADIINMSFSYTEMLDDTDFFPMRMVLDYARDEDVLVVAAAGNNGINNDYHADRAYPASYTDENIVSVASVSCTDDLSLFSNYGSTSVDIGVLGENIPGPDLGNQTVYTSGTSQSTAILSASAALLGTHIDEFEYATVKCLLLSNAREAAQAHITSSGGILDIHASVANVGGCEEEEEDDDNDEMRVAKQESHSLSLYQNVPNPFVGSTTITFDMPSSGRAALTVMDVTGKQIARKEFEGSRGLNRFVVTRDELQSTAGVMYYRIDTDQFSMTKKMIRIE